MKLENFKWKSVITEQMVIKVSFSGFNLILISSFNLKYIYIQQNTIEIEKNDFTENLKCYFKFKFI